MSIHSRRYQRYVGPLESPGSRFLPIAEAELRRIVKEKWARRLMLLAWLPVGFRAVMLYAFHVLKKATGYDMAGMSLYEGLLETELAFIAIMLAAFGASLISRDIETKALTLYFTRPVDAAQYHWGKLLATATLVLSVTLLPGIMLGIAQGVMADSFPVTEFLDAMWRLCVCSFGIAFTASNLMLLLSSTGWSSRYVGAMWLGLFTLLELARTALAAAFGETPILDLISLARLFTGSVKFLFAGQNDNLPALIALFAFGAFFFIALRVRLISLEKVRA